MKFLSLFGLASIVLFSFTACEKIVYKPQDEATNLNVFDDFSTLFLEKYAMFEQKGVNWPVLSDSVRATINDNTTEFELARKMGTMVRRLKDGHSYLYADSIFFYDISAGYPLNFDAANSKPEEEATVVSGGAYKSIGDIGYIYISDFVEWTNTQTSEAIDALSGTRALIIDVRINGGGDPEAAAELAARFTNTSYGAGIEYFKTGPGANDFSGSAITVTPSTNSRYLDKKVAILQARLSYSATQTLIYLCDENPNVATFGSKSGGGTGSVASGYLINGWQWNMSVSDYEDAKGRKFDGGLEADFPVLDDTDTDNDEVIEAAIDWING
ncbi:MAG: S41 family peptidase [Saprospiraceae bacterium]